MLPEMSRGIKKQPTRIRGHDVESTLAALAEEALKKFDGNRTHSAASLGISVRTMRNWIRRFNLQDKFPPVSRRPYNA